MEKVKRDVDEINELVEKITGKNPKAITTTQALNELVKGLTGDSINAITTSQALNYIEQNYNGGGSSIDTKTLDCIINVSFAESNDWIEVIQAIDYEILGYYISIMALLVNGTLGIFAPNCEVQGTFDDVEENSFAFTMGDDTYDISIEIDPDTGDNFVQIEKR